MSGQLVGEGDRPQKGGPSAAGLQVYVIIFGHLAGEGDRPRPVHKFIITFLHLITYIDHFN